MNPFESLNQFAALDKAASNVRNHNALMASAQGKYAVKPAPMIHGHRNAAQQASGIAAALVLPAVAAVQASLYAQSQPPATRQRGQAVLGNAPGAPAVNARRLLAKIKK